MEKHSEVFVGLTAAKVKNAVAIAEGERNGEVLYLGKIESTSEPTRRSSYRFLYETLYCQRGQMENRLNECQGDMFADRTPAPTTCANQLRQQLASFAYVLMCGAPYRPCRHEARSDHMRHHPAKLLKIGALATISARRVKLALASACPIVETSIAHAVDYRIDVAKTRLSTNPNRRGSSTSLPPRVPGDRSAVLEISAGRS